MTLAIETLFAANFIAMMGNSPVIAALVALGVFSVFLMMLKLPAPVLIMPLMAAFMIVIVQAVIPMANVLIVILLGFIVGYAIYRFWMGQ